MSMAKTLNESISFLGVSLSTERDQKVGGRAFAVVAHLFQCCSAHVGSPATLRRSETDLGGRAFARFDRFVRAVPFDGDPYVLGLLRSTVRPS